MNFNLVNFANFEVIVIVIISSLHLLSRSNWNRNDYFW